MIPARIDIPGSALAAIDAQARAAAPRECCGLIVGVPPGGAPGGASVAHDDDGGRGGLGPRTERAGELVLGLVVGRVVPMRNVAPEKTRYLIDPAEHFRLIRELRELRGPTATPPLEIVGAYHSHPASPPLPSPTDLADALPHFLYLIASPRAGGTGSDVRGWWMDQGNFREIPIVPVP